MKTTVELPDDLFREAKATAARRGKPMKDVLREALSDWLVRQRTPDARGPRQWPVPPPKISREDAQLIDKAIEEAFEQIDPEDWA